MKKRVVVFSFSIILFIFILVSLIALASANGYGDNIPIPNSVYCSDTDKGVYSTVKGTVTVSVSNRNYTDFCYTSGTVYEYYCSGTNYSNSYINCPSRYSCSNGVCIYTPVAEKLEISVATLKDTYKVGEAISLTDPPDDVQQARTRAPVERSREAARVDELRIEALHAMHAPHTPEGPPRRAMIHALEALRGKTLRLGRCQCARDPAWSGSQR